MISGSDGVYTKTASLNAENDALGVGRFGAFEPDFVRLDGGSARALRGFVAGRRQTPSGMGK
jgi:hypothetical protein